MRTRVRESAVAAAAGLDGAGLATVRYLSIKARYLRDTGSGTEYPVDETTAIDDWRQADSLPCGLGEANKEG